jgi:predicted nucleic acid-binding protein
VKTYADTSLLFSLYSTDANSPKTDAWRKANPDPLPFTAFHRLELRNALNLAVFQKRMTPVEVQSAWQEVENDIAAGLLVLRGGLWHRVLVDAESVAATHTSTIGSRTLDVLHVAAAKLTGATEFCTFDTRQAALAKRVGLSAVIP